MREKGVREVASHNSVIRAFYIDHDTSDFGNILEGVASGTEANSFGSIPPLAAMLSHMRRAILDDAKVLDAVVGSVPVDVVNNLFGSESAAKVALHDEAMLKDSPAFNADLSVSGALGDAPNSVALLVREAAVRGAEHAGIAFGSGLEAKENASAVGTRERDSFSQGGSSKARAQISFGADITSTPSIISLFDGADFSSVLHEAGHFFLEAHMDLAGRIAGRISDGEQVSDGERGIVADANALLGWFGVV